MIEYNFLTVWKFNAPPQKVYEAIHNADQYHLWWKGQSPVVSLKPGNALGVGAVKKFKTRSVLPYSLTYTGTVTEVVPLKKITGTTTGQLIGTGIWLFKAENDVTTVEYYWKVKTNSRWMNLMAPLLKPLFEWNHDVVMQRGGEGLAAYLGCQLLS